MHASLRRQLAIWLFLTAGFVFIMIVVGGLTRLTESGLSIVEWKPVSGTLPPLSSEAWQEEFSAYQTSPQYQKINHGMTLEEFKGIFWLEYWHRVGGRLIGIIFLLPMLYFMLRHRLPPWVKWRVTGIFALGGLQGAIGWYMVKSGLVDMPHVSPYRLSLHLGVAFLIMAACIWVAREILDNRAETSCVASPKAASALAALVCGFTFIQVVLGALVAGLDAGLTFNTFPLMDGRFVPKDVYMLEPLWRNHFENIAMVQFQHRIGAYILTALIGFFVFIAWRSANNTRMKVQLVLMVALLLLQIVLGISTLLLVVPIVLASKHQAVAAILFALTVWVWYDFNRLTKQAKKDGKPVAAGMEAKWQTAATKN